MVALSLVLAACGEEGSGPEDRRFANQPVTEASSTDVPPTVGSTRAPRPTQASSPDGETLLAARGAPSRFFALVDGQVLAIDAGTDPTVTALPVDDGTVVVDLASSPSGDRVVLLESPLDARQSHGTVVMLDASGNELVRWSLPHISGQPTASPVADGVADATSAGAITWSADGASLLVTSHDVITAIAVGGEPVVLDLPANVHRPTEASWSPAGDRIAALAHDGHGAGRIMVFDPDQPEQPATQVAPPRADTVGLGSVTRYAWLPSGEGFVFTLADEGSDPVAGGSMYVQQLDGGDRRLVATPGRGGPAAQIVDFALSPDGKSIAYVIATPGEESWAFNSMWVRSLRSDLSWEVPAAAPEGVHGLWWIDGGLAWREGPATFGLALSDGEILALDLRAPAGATPHASPAAATPVVVATPLVPSASPAASLVASPVDPGSEASPAAEPRG